MRWAWFAVVWWPHDARNTTTWSTRTLVPGTISAVVSHRALRWKTPLASSIWPGTVSGLGQTLNTWPCSGGKQKSCQHKSIGVEMWECAHWLDGHDDSIASAIITPRMPVHGDRIRPPRHSTRISHSISERKQSMA